MLEFVLSYNLCDKVGSKKLRMQSRLAKLRKDFLCALHKYELSSKLERSYLLILNIQPQKFG